MRTWDVSAAPPAQQFDRWRDVICEVFVPLAPTRPTDQGAFPSRVSARPLASITCAYLDSQPQRVAHGPREVTRSSDAWFFVNLQLSGRCLVRQGATETLVQAGQIAVVDTTRPYWFVLDQPWQMLSFRLPHTDLTRRLAEPEAIPGRVLDGRSGVGNVVAGLMTSLWQVHESLPGRAAAELHDTFAAMTALALDEVPAPDDADRRASLRAAVVRHAAARLSDPGLGVASVSREFGISPRSLHYLFTGTGATFAETLRDMRLERCAEHLADPADGRSITEIAARHGMPDSTSFARAFRRRFGVAPREYRAAAQVGHPSATAIES